MKNEINGYKRYFIKMNGDIWSDKTNKFLTPTKHHNGYMYVNLYNNGKMQHVAIHRLVAINFIKNPYNKPQVNHINGIKTDNRVENLEWVTNSENRRHAIKAGLIQYPQCCGHHNSTHTIEEHRQIMKLYNDGYTPINILRKLKINMTHQGINKITKKGVL